MKLEHAEDMKDGYYDWAVFKRILGYLKPYWKGVALSVTLLFVVALLNLAGPYLTKIAIDDHIKVANLEGLDTIAGLYLLVLVCAFVLQYSQTLLIQTIGQKVMYDLRTQVFAHLHKMSFSFFDRNPVGKMITRVVNDVEVLNEMLTSGLILVFSDVFTLVGIFIVLWVLDERLALAVCLVLPFLGIATQMYRRRARNALRNSRAYVTRLNSFLQETLSGMSTVQAYGRERIQTQQFEDINGKRLHEDLRSVHLNSVYMPSIDLFSAVAIGLIIWYGGGRFVQEQIQLGVLIAFIQYLQKFFEPIRDLAEKFNIIQTAMASSERIFELLDIPEERRTTGGDQPLASVQGKIQFKNVWFAYRDEEYVLKDLSFAVAPGESLAIVGATGSGKTSIVNVLCRFYEIQKGEILLDGVDIRSINKYDLRRRIAMVQQDVFLFSGNVSDNIRLGNEAIGTDEVEQIAQQVNAQHFIENLPMKYQQEVREGGTLLSLGQKQLLSFARALAVDPGILVLDEATSSIDLKTERLLQQAVKTLIANRTSIIIAHRLSTLEHVDKVLVLKKGRIQEFGTRQELLRQGGAFAKLLELQARH